MESPGLPDDRPAGTASGPDIRRDKLRLQAPSHATGAVEFVPLESLLPDESFKLRGEGDVTLLAQSIGRLGQLAPVELRLLPGAADGAPRWQVVAGFRRLAAIRMLERERVLARLHEHLSDDDAWGIALCHALLTEPYDAARLEALKTRLSATGIAPWAAELLDEALVRAPIAPEDRERFFEWLKQPRSVAAVAVAATAGVIVPPPPAEGAAPVPPAAAEPVEEVPADDFALDLAVRLSAVNQDLAQAFESWNDLPPEGRELVIEQCRYIAELFPFLTREDRQE